MLWTQIQSNLSFWANTLFLLTENKLFGAPKNQLLPPGPNNLFLLSTRPAEINCLAVLSSQTVILEAKVPRKEFIPIKKWWKSSNNLFLLSTRRAEINCLAAQTINFSRWSQTIYSYYQKINCFAHETINLPRKVRTIYFYLSRYQILEINCLANKFFAQTPCSGAQPLPTPLFFFYMIVRPPIYSVFILRSVLPFRLGRSVGAPFSGTPPKVNLQYSLGNP